PAELDQHRLMAAQGRGKDSGEVTPQEREQIGKRGRHATNYGMEGARFAEVLIKETEGEVVLTPDECQDIIDRVMLARPYIATWQRWVPERMLLQRKVPNACGPH